MRVPFRDLVRFRSSERPNPHKIKGTILPTRCCSLSIFLHLRGYDTVSAGTSRAAGRLMRTILRVRVYDAVDAGRSSDQSRR